MKQVLEAWKAGAMRLIPEKEGFALKCLRDAVAEIDRLLPQVRQTDFDRQKAAPTFIRISVLLGEGGLFGPQNDAR